MSHRNVLSACGNTEPPMDIRTDRQDMFHTGMCIKITARIPIMKDMISTSDIAVICTSCFPVLNAYSKELKIFASVKLESFERITQH